MKIYYQAIGINRTFEIYLDKIIENANALNMQTQYFGNIEKTQSFFNLDSLLQEKEPFYIIGSTRFLETFVNPDNIAKVDKIFPDLSAEDARQLFEKVSSGVFYNIEFFSQEEMFKDPLKKKHLLNSNSIIGNLQDYADIHYDKKFVKPVDDLKVFAGGLVLNKTIKEFLEEKITSGWMLEKNPRIILSDFIEIHEEVRCFVVDHQVIDVCLYRKNNSPPQQPLTEAEKETYKKVLDDIILPDFLNNKEIAPASFAIDLCKTPEGIKVVELNCINASGLYSLDVKKYLTALEHSVSLLQGIKEAKKYKL